MNKLRQKLLLSLLRDLREQQAVSEDLSDEVIVADLKKVLTKLTFITGGFTIATALEKLDSDKYPFKATLVKALENYHFYSGSLLRAFAQDHLFSSELVGTITIDPKKITLTDQLLGTKTFDVASLKRQTGTQRRTIRPKSHRPYVPDGPTGVITFKPAVPNFKKQ